MPIYEYECHSCKKRTELLQKMSDPPLTECPDCGGSVRKLVSAAGLHFKGSGWYVTDYAKKKGEGKEKEGSAEKSETKSTSSTEKTTKKKESPSKPAKSKD